MMKNRNVVDGVNKTPAAGTGGRNTASGLDTSAVQDSPVGRTPRLSDEWIELWTSLDETRASLAQAMARIGTLLNHFPPDSAEGQRYAQARDTIRARLLLVVEVATKMGIHASQSPDEEVRSLSWTSEAVNKAREAAQRHLRDARLGWAGFLAGTLVVEKMIAEDCPEAPDTLGVDISAAERQSVREEDEFDCGLMGLLDMDDHDAG